MKRMLASLTLAIVVVSLAFSQTTNRQNAKSRAGDQTALAKRMDQVVRFFADEQKIFMGSVLVARGSEVLLAKGYGMANLEWNIPNTPTTKFRLASLSKQFTAAAILLLEERGKLKVGDPIKKYMPDAPAAWDDITFHHLLSHTAGIVTDSPDVRRTDTLPSRPEQSILRFRDKPLAFPPGTRFGYSTSGYILLAYLIEKISSQRFEDFMRVNIFEPLGMKDSGSDSHAEVIQRRASGYEHPRDPNNRLRELVDSPIENAPYMDNTNRMGAGSIYSTVEDLHRWTQGLFGGKLLSAASVAMMTTPVSPNGYGYGLAVSTVEGRRRINHGGGTQGFHTVFHYYLDSKVTVVVLANFTTLPNPGTGNASVIIAQWLGMLAHGEVVNLPSERKAISVEAATLAEYAGVYEGLALTAAATKLEYTVTLEAGRLYLTGPRLPKSQMHAEAKDRFFLKERDVRIEFTRDETGRVAALALGRIRATRK